MLKEKNFIKMGRGLISKTVFGFHARSFGSQLIVMPSWYLTGFGDYCSFMNLWKYLVSLIN